MAYELFMSNEPFPLHTFLEQWKATTFPVDVGYVLAVIGAYNEMVRNCKDGRYKKIR